jgi:hypothetical protein
VNIDRMKARLSRWRTPGPALPAVVVLLVSALGLALRVEHALTFDGPARGSDYDVYLQGVRWMGAHWRPFDFDPSLPSGARYQPPLWFAAAAAVWKVTGSERAIAALSVAGWCLRQGLLARLLRPIGPEGAWAAVAALSLHAVLPLSVLIDGKVNPEGPHAALFMLALFALWRMERQADEPAGISTPAAALFGLGAGLALLTKASSAVLMLTAAAVLVVRVGWSARAEGLRATWRRLLRPAGVAALAWALVVAGWCGPNLARRGHPFPHDWDQEFPAPRSVHDTPVLYRRPLGWALPFELTYLRSPVIRSPTEPRANFWAPLVAGTWADAYNRGFCRLAGGPTTARVWGGDEGWFSLGPAWSVTHRCLRVYVALVRVGLLLTLASVLALLDTARRSLRTRGRDGSLVLPMAVALLVLFLMAFAVVYPLDDSAVVNPRYLLSAATPLCACLGLALARLRVRHRGLGRTAIGLCLGSIAVVGGLLCFERFGR